MRRHVLLHLATDVLTGRERITQGATLPAASRVAAWLVAREPAAGDVVWRDTQEQLAHLLGTSRVTVSRAVRRLVAGGAIRVTPRGIEAVDPAALTAFADPDGAA